MFSSRFLFLDVCFSLSPQCPVPGNSTQRERRLGWPGKPWSWGGAAPEELLATVLEWAGVCPLQNILSIILSIQPLLPRLPGATEPPHLSFCTFPGE